MKLVVSMLAIFVLAAAATAQAPAPLGLNNASVGGGPLNQYTPGVEGGTGLNNIGLLIRTWGKVTYVDTVNKYFYLDDGTGRLDGSGYTGVRASYDNLAPGNSITPPAVDQYIAITAISSTVVIGGKIQPNLRPRRDADIQVISQ